jgi:hypothetical protein
VIPSAFLARVLNPGLYLLAECGGPPVTNTARVMLLAIAGQESAWVARRQFGGPARGYWQFEQGGGVAGVMAHPATKAPLSRVCAVLDVPWDRAVLYEAVAWCDPLATVMARLLLWSDPKSLPTTEDAAWDCYVRTWRPGKPHRATWGDRWRAALAEVTAAGV